MNYSELAREFIKNMYILHKSKQQRQMNDFVKGEACILQYLDHNGSEAIPGELSESMCISSARIAAALNSLENKGLIVRQIDGSDRRRILVSLTADGENQAKERRRQICAGVEKMLRFLGENDAKEYLRIITKLAKIVNKEEE